MIAMEVVNIMERPEDMMLEGMEGSSNKHSPERLVQGWSGRATSPSHSAQAADSGASKSTSERRLPRSSTMAGLGAISPLAKSASPLQHQLTCQYGEELWRFYDVRKSIISVRNSLVEASRK